MQSHSRQPGASHLVRPVFLVTAFKHAPTKNDAQEPAAAHLKSGRKNEKLALHLSLSQPSLPTLMMIKNKKKKKRKKKEKKKKNKIKIQHSLGHGP